MNCLGGGAAGGISETAGPDSAKPRGVTSPTTLRKPTTNCPIRGASKQFFIHEFRQACLLYRPIEFQARIEPTSKGSLIVAGRAVLRERPPQAREALQMVRKPRLSCFSQYANEQSSGS